MKTKFLTKASFLGTALFFSLSAVGATVSKKDVYIPEKVTLAADIYCPNTCQPNSKDPGIMVEIAQRAFGLKNLNYIELPWTRALQEAKEFRIDGILGTVPKVMPDFLHSKTVTRSILCFYKHKNDDWIYKDHNSINDRKLGGISGYDYPNFVVEHINKKGKNPDIIISGDGVLLNLFKMLMIQRVNIVIEDEAVVKHILKLNPDLGENIKQAGCISDPESIYDLAIGFPIKNQLKSKRLLKQLNKTIDEMIKNGEMDKLLKKYDMKKWW